MANEKILFVDDDSDMREVLEAYMIKNGFSVFTAENGLLAISVVEERKPDLIVLDVMMPELDGFELCQLIRKKTNVPILFLSARGDDMDIILGLGIGGDDYITKSASPAEIMARIKAHLRRNRMLPQHNEVARAETENYNLLTFPDLVIDMDSAVVKARGSIVKLSAKEYQILCLMARHPDRIYSVELLFELIWGEQSLGDFRTVMVHLSNLRKKIECNPTKPAYIQTVRGIGYKFTCSVE